MKYMFYTTLILLTTVTHANDWQSCRLIENDQQRLACYDLLVAKLAPVPVIKHKEVVNQAKAKITVTPQTTSADNTPQLTPEDSKTATDIELFGREADVIKQQVKQLEQITAKVLTITYSARKQFTVVLDNNQKWKQTDTRSLRIKSQDTVIIERGSLGSFFLKKKDSGTRRRVKRVN